MKVRIIVPVYALFNAVVVSSFDLLFNDNTIRYGEDPSRCLSKTRKPNMKMKKCTTPDPDYNAWAYNAVTKQITLTGDTTKCLHVKYRKPSKTRRDIVFKDCDVNEERQRFTFNENDDGFLKATVGTKTYCASINSHNLRFIAMPCEFASALGTVSQRIEKLPYKRVGSTTVCAPELVINCGALSSACTTEVLTGNCKYRGKLCKTKNEGTGVPLKVASFNAQIMGDTKANREGVMLVYKEMFKLFDLIAFQEIRDSNQSGPEKFINEYLNSDSTVFEVLYSERDGGEQTAYYYRPEKLEVIKSTTFEDPNDKIWVRGPQAAHFRRKEADVVLTDFTMFQMHASASEKAFAEFNDMIRAQNILTNGGALEVDGEQIGPKITPGNEYPASFIFAGDFNAGSYIDPARELLEMLIDESYEFLIDNDADTNVNVSVEPYDRLVAVGSELIDSICRENHVPEGHTTSDVVNSDTGVFRFDNIFDTVKADYIAANPSADLTAAGLDVLTRVSDHWPVFMTIY